MLLRCVARARAPHLCRHSCLRSHPGTERLLRITPRSLPPAAWCSFSAPSHLPDLFSPPSGCSCSRRGGPHSHFFSFRTQLHRKFSVLLGLWQNIRHPRVELLLINRRLNDPPPPPAVCRDPCAGPSPLSKSRDLAQLVLCGGGVVGGCCRLRSATVARTSRPAPL